MENTDTTTNSEAENAEIAENTDTANATKNKSTRNNPQTSAQSKPQTSGTNSDPTTPAPPPASEKIWVPPVYKTVYHDAIYQTVKVVVCNYCNAEFSSAGEFQVHRDANRS